MSAKWQSDDEATSWSCLVSSGEPVRFSSTQTQIAWKPGSHNITSATGTDRLSNSMASLGSCSSRQQGQSHVHKHNFARFLFLYDLTHLGKIFSHAPLNHLSLSSGRSRRWHPKHVYWILLFHAAHCRTLWPGEQHFKEQLVYNIIINTFYGWSLSVFNNCHCCNNNNIFHLPAPPIHTLCQSQPYFDSGLFHYCYN